MFLMVELDFIFQVFFFFFHKKSDTLTAALGGLAHVKVQSYFIYFLGYFIFFIIVFQS